MKSARFYCSPIKQGIIELDRSEARHLAGARRLERGDIVELFDGSGGLARATVRAVERSKVVLEAGEVQRIEGRTDGRIVLAAGLAKGERFDWLVSKCTELGVDRICPVLFKRGVKLGRGSGKQERYFRLAVSAAKQCGRLFLPEIDQPIKFEDCLENLRRDYPQQRLLMGSVMVSANPLIKMNFDGRDVVVFVGPEGGLSETEASLLGEHGAEAVRLTDTVLRVETAGVAIVSILGSQRAAYMVDVNRDR